MTGAVVQSNYATFVYLKHKPSHVPTPIVPIERQQQFAIDALKGHRLWHSIADHAKPGFAPPAALPASKYRLQLNRSYETRTDHDGVKFLADGFSSPEEHGTWIDGLEGKLEFELERPVQDVELVLLVHARRPRATRKKQSCVVILNGAFVDHSPLQEGPNELQIKMARESFVGGLSRNTLCIVAEHAEQVYDAAGKVIDGRRLGVCLRSFGFFETSRHRIAAARPMRLLPYFVIRLLKRIRSYARRTGRA